MIHLLLVDNHELMRAGIRHVISGVKGISIVGEVENGEEAVRWCRTHSADVIIMDIQKPSAGSLETTRKITRFSNAGIRVIVLTNHTSNPLPASMMRAGAVGFLGKCATAQEVINAIRTVHAGQRYIAYDIAQQMALSQIDPSQASSPFSCLSARELQIMLILASGQKVPEIATQLNLSPKTVNSYRYRMFDKLKVNSDVALTLLAIRHGVIYVERLIHRE